MFRLLSPEESPLVLPLARGFFAEGHLPGKLNEQHFIANLKHHISKGTGFVIAAGLPIRGAISGIIFNDLATGELCVMEAAWFVHPEERGTLGLRLLAAFEKEGFSRGAQRILMAHLHTDKTEKFERMYERRGYVKREQIFTLERK